MLLEAIISLVIFAIGVLGLIGLQSAAIKSTNEARQRAVAAFYANQIIGSMWADSRVNLASYANKATGTTCGNFSGQASTNANVTAWITALQGELSGLTSVALATNLQQITVDTTLNPAWATPANPLGLPINIVGVTLCWINPGEALFHSFTVSAQIQG